MVLSSKRKKTKQIRQNKNTTKTNQQRSGGNYPVNADPFEIRGAGRWAE
jgi:hypothetical protein